jgi:hypothetical protein
MANPWENPVAKKETTTEKFGKTSEMVKKIINQLEKKYQDDRNKDDILFAWKEAEGDLENGNGYSAVCFLERATWVPADQKDDWRRAIHEVSAEYNSPIELNDVIDQLRDIFFNERRIFTENFSPDSSAGSKKYESKQVSAWSNAADALEADPSSEKALLIIEDKIAELDRDIDDAQDVVNIQIREKNIQGINHWKNVLNMRRERVNKLRRIREGIYQERYNKK